MPSGARIRLPKIPTHKALYAKKVEVKAIDKIDKIVEELGCAKHLVINSIICDFLGVTNKKQLDLTKWRK